MSWAISTLGDACEMYQPKTISASEMMPWGEYPVFGANGIIGRYNKYNHENAELLIACRGATCGAVNISLPKSWINGNAMVVRPKSGRLNKRFLEFLFRGQIDLSKIITGAAQFQITRQALSPVKIPIPSIDEQLQLVSVLDEAFAAIDRAKENLRRNLQNAKELFQSKLNTAFSQKGKGWIEKRLEECFKMKSGDMLTAKMMNDKGKFPVYGGNGIAGTHDKFNLSGSNVIIGRVGSFCGNARYINEKAWLTDNAFRLIDFNFEFDHTFITYLLNFKNLRSFARQSAQPVISNSSLKDIVLQFPSSLSEQKRIVLQLNTLSAETKELENIYQQKLNALDELKKSIFQKAFTGGFTQKQTKAIT